MGITASGWLDWAERVPGPVEKQYTQGNTVERYIPHSMVGTLNGWYSRLFDMTRNPDGRFTANATASVHGSILLNGHVIQHYPFFSSCWASGNRIANTTGIAFEHESLYTNGRPDETKPFTELQLLSTVRIIKELSEWRGWVPARPTTVLAPATLMEHNECVIFWGGGGTVCPSDRAEWNKILYLLAMNPDDILEGEDTMAGFVKDPTTSQFVTWLATANTRRKMKSGKERADMAKVLGISEDPIVIDAETFLALKEVN